MKRFAVVLLLLFGLHGVLLCQVNGGPKLGINFSNQYHKMLTDTEKPVASTLVGYHVGGELLVQLPVVGMEFEANLLLMRKGCKYAVGEGEAKFEHSRSLYYLDLPLRINYSVGLATTGLFVGAGSTVSVGLFGWDKTKGAEEEKVKWGSKPNELNRFDIALGAQLGIRYKGMQLSGFFDWGFLNTLHHEHVKTTNYYGGISFAYLF